MKCSWVLWIQTRGQYLRQGHQQLLYTHSTSPCHEVFMCLMNPNKRPISQTWTSTAPLHPFNLSMSWSVHVSYESKQDDNISDMDINSSFTPIQPLHVMKCSCVLWIQTRGQYLRHGHQQLLYTHSTSPYHEVFMCLMNPNKRPISQTWTSTAPLHPFNLSMSWSVHVSYESKQEANISDMDINSSFTPIQPLHVMKCSCVLWIQTRWQYLRHGHQQLLYTHSTSPCHEVFMCLMNPNKRPISQTWTSTAPLHPFNLSMSWSVHVSYESKQEANISDMDINSSFTPIQPLHCPLTLSYESKQEANISEMDINSSFTPIQPLHVMKCSCVLWIQTRWQYLRHGHQQLLYTHSTSPLSINIVLWIQTRGQYLRNGHQQLLYTHSTSPCYEVFMCLMNPNKRPISQTWTSTAPLHPFNLSMLWSVHVSYESKQEANISDMDINSSFTPIQPLHCPLTLLNLQKLGLGHSTQWYVVFSHGIYLLNKSLIRET